MNNNYLLTYCDDLPALQAWLAANAAGNESHIYRTRAGFSHDYSDYVFILMQKSQVIKNEDGDKTLAFMVASDEQKQIIESSPIEILGEGITPSSPYAAVMQSSEALLKYREVISEERQLNEYGNDFNFCRV
jgi:hypothetical protein